MNREKKGYVIIFRVEMSSKYKISQHSPAFVKSMYFVFHYRPDALRLLIGFYSRGVFKGLKPKVYSRLASGCLKAR